MDLMQYQENNPLSICECGHTGDGANSEHATIFQYGHGACNVDGCNCKQFTWVKWTAEAQNILNLKEVK
jgi:hypothetical protein